MVLLVVYAILMGESLNSLVMYLVCLPVYVNVAHLLLFCFGF
jgi:hypothetical protein